MPIIRKQVSKLIELACGQDPDYHFTFSLFIYLLPRLKALAYKQNMQKVPYPESMYILKSKHLLSTMAGGNIIVASLQHFPTPAVHSQCSGWGPDDSQTDCHHPIAIIFKIKDEMIKKDKKKLDSQWLGTG